MAEPARLPEWSNVTLQRLRRSNVTLLRCRARRRDPAAVRRGGGAGRGGAAVEARDARQAAAAAHDRGGRQRAGVRAGGGAEPGVGLRAGRSGRCTRPAATVAGERAYPRVAELPGVPDAAFVAVPAPACAPVVAELAAAGLRRGGGLQLGLRRDRPGRRGAAARRCSPRPGSMPLLGPNCYGLVNYAERVLIWPDQHGGVALAAGERGVAVVSQSSSIAISVTMADSGLPLASVVTVGNAAQLGVAPVAEALLDSERVSAVGLIVESLADLRGLGAAGRLRPGPPDRPGRAGARAAASRPARRSITPHRLARGRRRGRRGVPAPQRDRPGRARSTRCSAPCACCTAAARCPAPGSRSL